MAPDKLVLTTRTKNRAAVQQLPPWFHGGRIVTQAVWKTLDGSTRRVAVLGVSQYGIRCTAGGYDYVVERNRLTPQC